MIVSCSAFPIQGLPNLQAQSPALLQCNDFGWAALAVYRLETIMLSAYSKGGVYVGWIGTFYRLLSTWVSVG